MLRPVSRRPISIVIAAALSSLLWTGISCAGAPKPRQLGEYSVLTPRLAVVDSEHPPVNLTVELSAPASIVVAYVSPGRSTRIVYPADTMGAARLAAGVQRITASWPAPRAALDRARRDSIARANAGRVGRDTIGRGRTQTIRALPDPESGLAPEGYLLLFATPSSLPYAEVRRKVEGVTTPLDDDEALNAIAKQVRSTLPGSAQWAAYAVDIVVETDAPRMPPRNVQRPR